MIKGIIPTLPPRAWRVLAADGVAALGTGLVLPFLLVYLRDVRNVSVTTGGFVIAFLAIVSLACGPPAGSFVDRFGPRHTLMASLCLCSAGSVSLALTRETWHAFVAAGLIGAGFAAMWPGTHSLLASLVATEQRSAVFSVHYATLNLGIGLGGIIGGLFADVGNPRTFELLYTFDALSWLFFAAVLFLMRDIGGRSEPTADGLQQAGYRAVIQDRLFLRLMAITVMLVTVGYSQLESGYPAYVTGEGGASTRLLGAAFAANTFFIVVAQLFVLRWLTGKRRTRALMAICILWAIAWMFTIGAGQIETQIIRNIGFILAMVFIALGECMVSPSIPGILNDLAPDELRGRYNGAYSLCFSMGHIVGPAIAGVMIDRQLSEPFFFGLIVACLLTIGMIRSLERRLPEEINVVQGDAPVAPSPANEERIVSV